MPPSWVESSTIAPAVRDRRRHDDRQTRDLLDLAGVDRVVGRLTPQRVGDDRVRHQVGVLRVVDASVSGL
jgi:hypothetical protein